MQKYHTSPDLHQLLGSRPLPPLQKHGYKTLKSIDGSHLLYVNNNGLCVVSLTRTWIEAKFTVKVKDKIRSASTAICALKYSHEEPLEEPFSLPLPGAVIYDLHAHLPGSEQVQFESTEFLMAVMPSKQETFQAYTEL